MRKREALKLHNGDEVIVKRDSSPRRVLNDVWVEPGSGDVMIETVGPAENGHGGVREVFRHREVR